MKSKYMEWLTCDCYQSSFPIKQFCYQDGTELSTFSSSNIISILRALFSNTCQKNTWNYNTFCCAVVWRSLPNHFVVSVHLVSQVYIRTAHVIVVYGLGTFIMFIIIPVSHNIFQNSKVLWTKLVGFCQEIEFWG